MSRTGRWCGIVAGPLFVVVFLVGGAVRVDYNPVRHPVSDLALGPWGWTQTVSFFLCGVLGLVFAIGLWRAGRGLTGILVGLWAIGLIGVGLFVSDPIGGYPPGASAEPTRTGMLHGLFSSLVLFGLTAACLIFAGSRGWLWLAYSAVSGVVFSVAFMVSGTGFAQVPNLADTAGLWQRIAIIVGWTWLTVLAYMSKELSSS